MAVNLPIITEFDGAGINKAIAQFKQLETTGQKAQFALKKAAIPAAAALAGIAAAAGPAITAASDLNENLSKVNVIFGEGAAEIEKFAASAAKSLGQSKNAVLTAAGTFGTFGKAAGLSGKELATFSNDFTALASDLASFNNTSPEQAVQAIGAALRGESEPLRQYGVLLNDASLKAAALSLGIYDGSGALTDQQKILAAQKVIFEQTSDAQGDFARTSDGLANSQRTLTAQIENLQTSIGQALLPALEKVLPKLTSFAQWAANNPDLFIKVGAAIAGIASAIFLVNAAMATNPFVLATAGVIGLALAFNKLVDSVSEINKIGGLAAKLLGMVVSPVTGLAGNILRGLPDVGNLLNNGTTPKPAGLNIPRMAEGGVVSSATLAIIGEAGPEAVVPLDKMRGMGGNVVINISGGLGTSTDIANAVYENLRFYNQNVGPLRIRTA